MASFSPAKGGIKLISTGREIRTPINGFGDRYSAIELCPYES